MGNEWKETTLGRIALGADGAVDGPFGSNLPASCYTPTGIPIIRGSNLTLGPSRFKSEDFVYTSEDMFQKLRRSECLPGDIIFTKKGTLGQTGIVPCDKKYDKYLLSSNQMRLRIDSELADSEFVYYYVSSEASLEKIKRESEATGVPKINLEYLRNFPIRLPTLNVQKKTVNILKSLDNKIELNRQLNQTLEQMAQALFKSWFVDCDPVIDNALAAGNPIPDDLQDRALLRQGIRQQQLAKTDHKPLPENIRKLFPSEFELTESLGWVPLGWHVSSTDQIAKTNPISWTAKNAPDFVEYVDLSNAKNGVIEDTICYEFGEAPSRARRVLEPHDTIFGLVRPGNRSFAYVHNQGLTGSTGFAVMRPKSENLRAFLYFHLTRDDVVDEFARIADGAAYPAIRPEEVTNLETVIPSSEILNHYQNIAGNALNKIGQNYFQNKELSQLRDTLLPKLISGELRIPEAESALTLALSQRERELESANE